MLEQKSTVKQWVKDKPDSTHLYGVSSDVIFLHKLIYFILSRRKTCTILCIQYHPFLRFDKYSRYIRRWLAVNGLLKVTEDLLVYLVQILKK